MPTDTDLPRYESMLTSLLRGSLARYTAAHPHDVAAAFARFVLGEPAQGTPTPPPGPRAIHQHLFAYAASRVGQPDAAAPVELSSLPPTTAASGTKWTHLAWAALRDTGLRPVTLEPHGSAVHVTLGRLIAYQTPAGHFLEPSANDNLESWWYAELILLHAIGTYAALTGDAPAYRAAERAAVYHLNETQPDHATNEPWAIFPFLLQPPTRSLADQLLHNANMMPADGASLLLLADALYCLRNFLLRGTA